MHKKPQRDKNSRARIHTSFGLRKTRTASVNELLARKPGLRALTAARPPEDGWSQWLAGKLPPDLAPHVCGVLLKADTLVIYATNAAWSSRLRYALAALLADISVRDARIHRTVVRVRLAGAGTPPA
jgi:hypothetical protein